MKPLLNVKKFGRLLRRNLSLGIGFLILASLIIFGFVVSHFAPYDPRRWGTVPKNLPPSSAYPFGTTSVGQDVFWLLSYAIKNSVILGAVASLVGLLIGLPLGLIAGYKGGLVDKVILFFADTFIILPGLPILIFAASIIKSQLDMVSLGLLIASITWGMPVRNVRSMVLSLREREFTYTALFSGNRTLKIIFYEYMPHVLPWVFASFMGRTLASMGMEVTLAIFGLSTLQEATFGTMIYWANRYQAMVRRIWWWIGSPVIFLIILFLSLYLFSVGINEQLNPRARKLRTGAK